MQNDDSNRPTLNRFNKSKEEDSVSSKEAAGDMWAQILLIPPDAEASRILREQQTLQEVEGELKARANRAQVIIEAQNRRAEAQADRAQARIEEQKIHGKAQVARAEARANRAQVIIEAQKIHEKAQADRAQARIGEQKGRETDTIETRRKMHEAKKTRIETKGTTLEWRIVRQLCQSAHQRNWLSHQKPMSVVARPNGEPLPEDMSRWKTFRFDDRETWESQEEVIAAAKQSFRGVGINNLRVVIKKEPSSDKLAFLLPAEDVAKLPAIYRQMRDQDKKQKAGAEPMENPLHVVSETVPEGRASSPNRAADVGVQTR